MRLVTEHAAPTRDDASLTFQRSEMNAVPKPSSSPRRASSLSVPGPPPPGPRDPRRLRRLAGSNPTRREHAHSCPYPLLVSAIPDLGDPPVDDAEDFH